MEWKIISNKSALPSEKCSHRTASESALTLYQSAALCGGGDLGAAVTVNAACQSQGRASAAAAESAGASAAAKRSVLLSKHGAGGLLPVASLSLRADDGSASVSRPDPRPREGNRMRLRLSPSQRGCTEQRKDSLAHRVRPPHPLSASKLV